MSIQHQKLSSGAWQKLTFTEQMANIGSEVIRANNWKEKGNQRYSRLAADRALELLYLTIDDPKNYSRLKELARLYEILGDCLYGDNLYQSDAQKLNNYFLAFNFAARLHSQDSVP